MTSLTVPAPPAGDTSPQPVPWRRMAWITWRQHRFALAGVAALLGALALYLWLTGVPVHHAYATAAACRPAGSLACQNLIDNFNQAYTLQAQITAALLQVVPALIGAFAGAPVLARELETGTFRYAWTQGFGRWRWTVAKLVLLTVTVTAAAGALSVLYSWSLRPFLAEGQVSPLLPVVFDLRGVAFAAWTLAAFAIGAAAGMLIRRVVPAIAATLTVYAGLAFATGTHLRQHYLAPLVTHTTSLPASAWILDHWYTGRNGKPLSQATISQILQGAKPVARQAGPHEFTKVLSVVQYLTQHGYTYWVSYQPGSRFWPFQWIEGGWLLVLSVLLLAGTVWLVRHRAA